MMLSRGSGGAATNRFEPRSPASSEEKRAKITDRSGRSPLFENASAMAMTAADPEALSFAPGK